MESFGENIFTMDKFTLSKNNAFSLHSHPSFSILEPEKREEWKPRKAEYLVMITISMISLMVALDATILVPVLPVGHPLLNVIVHC